VAEPGPAVIKPPRLRPGDTIGLINPVSFGVEPAILQSVRQALEALGMAVRCGAWTSTTANERERASEVNALFADPEVRAILPVRGGWGSARLLPHLDYELIRRNPKIVLGASDVGALLLGIHARTGLVTFHGPMGISSWVPFTVEQMKRVIFECEAARIGRLEDGDEEAAEQRPRTITPGLARGRLLGGNLTVVSSMVGSPYLGGGDDLILFLEEVREATSEVARMLTQLEQAGILGRVRGLVFGQCTRCPSPQVDEELTLERVLAEQVGSLGIPAWRGAQIGHVERQLTVPIGVRAEIDASVGVIQLLEPAVC
jgi:muramoyltetrapeptide carboxypeptidase